MLYSYHHDPSTPQSWRESYSVAAAQWPRKIAHIMSLLIVDVVRTWPWRTTTRRCSRTFTPAPYFASWKRKTTTSWLTWRKKNIGLWQRRNFFLIFVAKGKINTLCLRETHGPKYSIQCQQKHWSSVAICGRFFVVFLCLCILSDKSKTSQLRWRSILDNGLFLESSITNTIRWFFASNLVR